MSVSVCGRVKADIVFLVDESWSIGSNNFGKLKDFLFRIVTYFPLIGPQGTQVRPCHCIAEILTTWHRDLKCFILLKKKTD